MLSYVTRFFILPTLRRFIMVSLELLRLANQPNPCLTIRAQSASAFFGKFGRRGNESPLRDFELGT